MFKKKEKLANGSIRDLANLADEVAELRKLKDKTKKIIKKMGIDNNKVIKSSFE